MLAVRPSGTGVSSLEQRVLAVLHHRGVFFCEFIGNNIRVNNYWKGMYIVQVTKCIIVTQYIAINLPKKLSAFKFLCLLVITNNK